jgi:hypothetical protein
MEKVTKIGLKSNSHFLFELMNGNTQGGSINERDIFHRCEIHLNENQLNEFKNKISQFGYNVEKSLNQVRYYKEEFDLDYSCDLTKI